MLIKKFSEKCLVHFRGILADGQNPKSMGHGKVMPPNTTNEAIVETFLMHMCEKLGTRLRRHNFRAQYFFAGLLNREVGWYGSRGKSIQPINDSKEIFLLASFLIHQHWHGEPVTHIQVTALDPSSEGLQMDFFIQTDEKREGLYVAVDEINERFGEFTISPATMLHRKPPIIPRN